MNKFTFQPIILFCFCIFFFNKSAMCQKNHRDSSIFMSLIKLGYSANFPSNDLKDRFGFTSSINTKFEVKFKNQIILGAKYDFLWGNNVKDTGMLEELKTSFGGIINADGQFGTYELLQRGHHLGLYVGRLFPYFSPNPNSGIIATVGVGLLVHKVNFNNINGDIIQLNGEYKKGYDRYTSGISFSQFIGYRLLSNNKLLNFYAGVGFTQAFTKIRRDYQVDYAIDDSRFGERKDFLFNIQIGWILPLYNRAPREFYY